MEALVFYGKYGKMTKWRPWYFMVSTGNDEMEALVFFDKYGKMTKWRPW
jgi:hypothetical protein